ncbi:MAG: response regulator transcription factor [Gammaproteobacteria bacterium]|nr:response regulator transcription factor [Gammaproteobacteria bacterium]
MTSILLADDDVELTQMITEYLAQEGFAVDTAHDGKTALHKAIHGNYAVMILDVMMPQLNGFDVLRQLRVQAQLPVLMLTARGEDVDSIVGLELGADDYLAKPCNPRVLVARLRAILRRSDSLPAAQSTPNGDCLVVGDIELQISARRVLLMGQPVVMTSTEYSVLELLLRDAGRVISKQQLCERALGREINRYDRSLDMHVSNLRRKLGVLPDGQERIKTVRGIGYQYTVPVHA